MPDLFCPCGSGENYSECCERFISGNAVAPTAEKLMRSRFSAYAKSQVEYLIETCHPTIRNDWDATSLRKWCKQNRWKKLKVLNTSFGLEGDTKGEVTFKAYYQDQKFQLHEHHEHSYFVKENGRWYYLSAEFPK